MLIWVRDFRVNFYKVVVRNKTALGGPGPLPHKFIFLKITEGKLLLEHCVSELSQKEYAAII